MKFTLVTKTKIDSLDATNSKLTTEVEKIGLLGDDGISQVIYTGHGRKFTGNEENRIKRMIVIMDMATYSLGDDYRINERGCLTIGAYTVRQLSQSDGETFLATINS